MKEIKERKKESRQQNMEEISTEASPWRKKGNARNTRGKIYKKLNKNAGKKKYDRAG